MSKAFPGQFYQRHTSFPVTLNPPSRFMEIECTDGVSGSMVITSLRGPASQTRYVRDGMTYQGEVVTIHSVSGIDAVGVWH